MRIRPASPSSSASTRTARGLCPAGLPARIGPPARLFRLPLVGHPRARIHPQRLRQDQLRGRIRIRLQRDDGGRPAAPPSTQILWERFVHHLGKGSRRDRRLPRLPHGAHAPGFPELVLDLLCHGPIEKGQDASHGGVEFTTCAWTAPRWRPWPIRSPRSSSASRKKAA